MVRTRFEWRYGGRQVFLCGSFTEWSRHIPMALAEGSCMIFQEICDLPPGYYQYKYLVDGVWMVDKQELCVLDEYGTENNLVIVKEPEGVHISPTLYADSFKSSMDVDKNGILQHSASLSGGMHHEPVLQLLDSNLDVSRRHLCMLLSRYMAYELLPESGKVIALNVKLAVKQAFHIMYEQGLAVVPLWDDCKRQLSGMLTASDFISILRELHNNGSMLTNEELELHTIYAWKEGKIQLHRESVGATQPLSRGPLIQAGPDESLKDVALRILQNKISTVPVIHSTQDGSCPQLLHVACLSGILKYICRHFRHCPGVLLILKQPVGSLPLGTWVRETGRASGCLLTTLHHNERLSSALNLLIEAQISSIPIVDDKGSLMDVYSRSDITSLAKGNVYARIPLDQMNMHQALQLVYEANGDVYTHKQCQTCLRTDTLLHVMERLSDPVVRRLIVIEAAGSRHVEGIITLRDVFNFILS